MNKVLQDTIYYLADNPLTADEKTKLTIIVRRVMEQVRPPKDDDFAEILINEITS